MIVRSEDEWQKYCAEIAADPDVRAQPFHDFLVKWADLAEEWLGVDPDYTPSPSESVEALRETLRAAEEKGRWTVGYLGMALILFSTHWLYAGEPAEFFNGLTQLEQNLYMDVAAVKLDVQEQAAEEPA